MPFSIVRTYYFHNATQSIPAKILFKSFYPYVYEFLPCVRGVHDREHRVYLYAHVYAHLTLPCEYVRERACARVHDHAYENARGCVFCLYEDARGSAYANAHGSEHVCVRVFLS